MSGANCDFRYSTFFTAFRELSRKSRVTVLTARQPAPGHRRGVSEGPIVVDYLYLMKRLERMDSATLFSHLQSDVAKYAPDCVESVRRNGHMNSYDGHVPIVVAEVGPWLSGFAEHFSSRYKGASVTGDVMMGMASCAKSWRLKPGLSHSDQDTRDAVVVDFINFVAGRRGMDLALYTKDLKSAAPGDEVYS